MQPSILLQRPKTAESDPRFAENKNCGTMIGAFFSVTKIPEKSPMTTGTVAGFVTADKKKKKRNLKVGRFSEC